jgi:hypothetical protein
VAFKLPTSDPPVVMLPPFQSLEASVLRLRAKFEQRPDQEKPISAHQVYAALCGGNQMISFDQNLNLDKDIAIREQMIVQNLPEGLITDENDMKDLSSLILDESNSSQPQMKENKVAVIRNTANNQNKTSECIACHKHAQSSFNDL